MRPIIVILMAWCLSMGAYAATAPDAKQLTQELEQAKAAKPAQPETVESLQAALNALEERKGSLERAQQYQQVIDNFPKLSQTLRAQLTEAQANTTQVSAERDRLFKNYQRYLKGSQAAVNPLRPCCAACVWRRARFWAQRLAATPTKPHALRS